MEFSEEMNIYLIQQVEQRPILWKKDEFHPTRHERMQVFIELQRIINQEFDTTYLGKYKCAKNLKLKL